MYMTSTEAKSASLRSIIIAPQQIASVFTLQVFTSTNMYKHMNYIVYKWPLLNKYYCATSEAPPLIHLAVAKVTLTIRKYNLSAKLLSDKTYMYVCKCKLL